MKSYLPSPIALRTAVRALKLGEVVAYPTEAVWGLGCDPRNAAAFQRLLALKRRDVRKGVILIAHDFARLSPWLDPQVPDANRAQALASWPGPHTWIWPAASWVPDWLTGGRRSIAVRVSAHPVAAALCDAWGGPLVSTSANRSGREPARNIAELRLAFGPALVAVPGAIGSSPRPTSIRDLVSGAVIRA